MSYDDELLLATRTAIQKVASVKVELLTFPHVYNELDTEKMIQQINEAMPTLIINAADKKWLRNISIDAEIAAVGEGDLRALAYGRLHFFTYEKSEDKTVKKLPL